MSKLSETKRVGAEDMPGAPEWFIEGYLPYQNSFNEDVSARINGDIGLVNLNDAVRTSKMTHGVEKIVSNPLGKPGRRPRPIGITVIDSAGLPVAGSVTWRNVAGDKIGIMVNFDLQHTFPFLVKQSPLFNLASGGGGTKVTGWVSPAARGSVISESAGNWTVSEAGTYAITVYNNWEIGGSAYTRALTTLAGVLANTCESDLAVAATTVGPGPDNTMSTIANLAAGATWSLTALQTNGAGTARTPTFNMQVQRLYNATSYTANVTFRIMGP